MKRDRSKRQFRVLSSPRGAPTNEQTRRSRRLYEVLQPGGAPPKKPVNPYYGYIKREMWVEIISDYESLSDTDWQTTTFTAAGETLNVIYGHLNVPNQATDDVEVIMRPLRYSIDGAASAGDSFDFLNNRCMKSELFNGPFTYGRRIPSRTNQEAFEFSEYQYLTKGLLRYTLLTTQGLGYTPDIHASATLLPVSGDSHYSDGDLRYLSLVTGPKFPQRFADPVENVFDAIAVAEGVTSPSEIGYPYVPDNFTLGIKYVRLRINGVAVGSLLDFSDKLAPVSGFQRTNMLPQVPLGLHSILILYFPSAPDDYNKPRYPNAPFQLSFTAGDTIEIDVWYSMRSMPSYHLGMLEQDSRAAHYFCVIPVDNATDGYRSGFINVPAEGKYIERGLLLHGLIANPGWDYKTDTYSFEFADGVWHAGTGDPGVQKAREIGATPVTDVPYVVSIGVHVDGSGTISVPMPATYAAGDTLLLIVETINATMTTPTGWGAIGLGGGIGAADGTGTRLYCFYKLAAASESSVSLTYAQPKTGLVMAIRGGSGVSLGSIFSVATKATDTVGTLGGVATRTANALAVLIGTNASTADHECTIENTTLDTLTAHDVIATTSGIAIAYGSKASAGSIGTTTFTWNSSANQHMAALVFSPPSVNAGWLVPAFASNSLRWNGTIQKGIWAGYSASIDLWFGGEIAEVVLTVLSNHTNPVDQRRYFCIYRPQNSGDYVTTVTDRKEGTLTFGPCGVFNGLGTTIFERWNGVLNTTEVATFDDEMPTSITVRHATQ